MGCKHENLRAVGFKLFCKDCGQELPADYVANGEKRAEKPAPAPKPDKAPVKKKTAKKAE